jgi:hypothetical protein
MTIEVKKSIQRVEVYPGIEGEGGTEDPTLMVVLTIETDDPDDSDLPVTATDVKHFQNGDDISSMPQLVSDIASGIWSNTNDE